jgi:hypothetical protein
MRLFILCFAVSTILPGMTLFAQEDTDTVETAEPPAEQPAPEIADTPAPEENADGATSTDPDRIILASIKGDLKKYVVNYQDSTVLQNRKKREFTARAKAINKRYIGTKLSFKQACVSDVTPQTELTALGHQKAKQMISKLRRDPQGKQILALWGSNLKDNPMLQFYVATSLIGCKKCKRETGRYDVKFILAAQSGQCQFQSTGDTLEAVVSSESEALNYVKNQSYPISGVVKGIELKQGLENVDVNIFLK